MPKKPNFIVFITDQQRADWLGCMGHPVLRTPNIDAIAERGTIFENFHVASPVCMPNRASILTGRWPTQHGLRYNGCVLPERANTFVDILASAGYETAAIGKSHIQPFLDTPAIRPAPARTPLISESWKEEAADYGQEEPGRYQSDGRYDFQTPYYGYRLVDMVTNHGDRCGGHYEQWFREQADDWQALHDPANEIPHNYSCPQAYRTPIPEALYPTSYIRDRAVGFLNQRRDDDAPFFLFVSFPDPHHPFNPPGRYWDMYHPEQFDAPLAYGDHDNPTPPMRWLHQAWQSGAPPATAQTAFMTDAQNIREAKALTAGMITMIDDAIGDIMTALNDGGAGNDTVVCFTADHGDYLGDFNLMLKGALPFRSITRVPFIWSDPQNRGIMRSAAMASSVDLSATVLDRADLPQFNGAMGKSLMGAIEGGCGREDLLVEYNDSTARLGFSAPARVRSLVTPDYRFTLYGNQEWGEFYDLKVDPDETRNLWDAPEMADTKAAFSLRLNHVLTGLMDESPVSNRMA